jgi:hypothetical protein
VDRSRNPSAYDTEAHQPDRDVVSHMRSYLEDLIDDPLGIVEGEAALLANRLLHLGVQP